MAKSRRRHGGAMAPIGGLSLTGLQRAARAVEALMECNGFWEGTKEEFATKMGWPDRRAVEEAQRITQDQDRWPAAKQVLGGFRIGYAPSQGGMTLIGRDGELPLDQQLHFLSGDLQRQQGEKTILRRRIPNWKAIGDQAAKTGELDVARICWQCANELDAHGFVSDHLTGEYLQLLATRGIT